MTAPQISDPQKVSALCIACGLCCTGAIYDAAEHQPDEDELATSLGMEVLKATDNQPARLRLPCTQLNGTACMAYDRLRPKVCGDFFCALARKLDAGDDTLDGALAKVAAARRLLVEIMPLMHDGEDIVETRTRWAASAGEWLAGPESARLHMLMTSLNLHFDRHFRGSKEPVMQFGNG